MKFSPISRKQDLFIYYKIQIGAKLKVDIHYQYMVMEIELIIARRKREEKRQSHC